ncbi:hypothetical protein [Streptomyces sp. NBC_01618]|uniref:hypothetical protein n=1 Tax=Streptomyces sp. NBC_01618 TaxID=2975900 RepID=UPI00386F0C41|nr:hypothetical protein OH735_28135 [Streptomyces sp. NBC_01618]
MTDRVRGRGRSVGRGREVRLDPVGRGLGDLGLTETAVRDWVKQTRVDAGERNGLTSSEREELAALRRENRRLREEFDILKRVTASFAKETR